MRRLKRDCPGRPETVKQTAVYEVIADSYDDFSSLEILIQKLNLPTQSMLLIIFQIRTGTLASRLEH